jgi:hypothetical protein
MNIIMEMQRQVVFYIHLFPAYFFVVVDEIHNFSLFQFFEFFILS